MVRTLAITVVLAGVLVSVADGEISRSLWLYGCFDPNTPSTEWVMPADKRTLDIAQELLPDGSYWIYHNHPWVYPSQQRNSMTSHGIASVNGRTLSSSAPYIGPEVSCPGEPTGYRIELRHWDSEIGNPPLSAWPSPAKFSGYLDDSVDAADAGYMFRWWNTFVADLTGDDITDAADVGVLFAEWTGDISPVPEPTGTAWLILAVLCSQRRSRR